MKSSKLFMLTTMAAIAVLILSLASSAADGKAFSYQIAQDSIMDQYYSTVFGPIPLSGAPADTVYIPLAGNYASGTPVSLAAVPLKLKWIYHVELKDTMQILNVNVTNNSAANFSSVIIALGSLGADTINNLPANATAAAQYSARAQVIDSVINVTVSFTPATTGAFTAGNSLSAGMSLNGLYATKVVVLDSMFAGYQRSFTTQYAITDTVAVDYMDINQGFFNYTVTNYTGIELLLSIEHRNLWFADFCRGRNPPLNSVNNLTGLSRADSTNAYDGDVTPSSARIDFPAGQISKFMKTNISGCRMFPEWDPATKKSVTKVDYLVNVGLYGRRVTLAADDSITFVIKSVAFRYNDISGTVMETYKRSSDSLKFAIPASWLAGPIPDNLFCDFFTAVNMPTGAAVDTLGVSQKIFSAKYPDSSCQWSAKFTPALSNSFINQQMDIARVIRLNPDTICIIASNTIPVGTHVVLVNDLTVATDTVFPKYIGRMIIRDSLTFALSTAVLHGHAALQTFACEGMFPVLRYALREQCRVSAACYDLRGRLVYSYVNKSQGPGSYALPIPAASWPRGAYCMVFKAGSFERMEKVMVIR